MKGALNWKWVYEKQIRPQLLIIPMPLSTSICFKYRRTGKVDPKYTLCFSDHKVWAELPFSNKHLRTSRS